MGGQEEPEQTKEFMQCAMQWT